MHLLVLFFIMSTSRVLTSCVSLYVYYGPGSLNYSKSGDHRNFERVVVNGPDGLLTDADAYFSTIYCMRSIALTEEEVVLMIDRHREISNECLNERLWRSLEQSIDCMT